MIPFNPCGRAVDWGRTGYRTQAWFTKDHTTQYTNIVWYFTDLPFQENDSAINSRIWDSDDVRRLDLGEVLDAPRQGPYRHAVGGLTGEHQCGDPEMFMNGAPVPYLGPPVEYNDQWIPLCCEAGPRGGIEIGGSAGDQYTPPGPPPQGIEIGGSAGDVYTPPVVLGQGVEIGGSAGDYYTIPERTHGGMEIGGEAGDEYEAPNRTQGGIEIGGEAGDDFTPGGPGPTCETAEAVTDSVWTAWAVLAPFQVAWYYWPVSTPFEEHMQAQVSAGTITWNAYNGGCGGLAPIALGGSGAFGFNLFPGASSPLFLQITAGSFGATVRVNMGFGPPV